MDEEIWAALDDLEALFTADEDDLLGDAGPTNNCTDVGAGCS